MSIKDVYDEIFRKHKKPVGYRNWGKCDNCGNEATSRDPIAPLLPGLRYLDDGYYCDNCSTERFDKALEQRTNEQKAWIKRTPPTKPQPPSPPMLSQEQLFNFNDKDHPKNSCYTCHRPLPPDYHHKPWNQHDGTGSPMFDTQKCRDSAVRRHLHPVEYKVTNLTNKIDFSADREKQLTFEHNEELDRKADAAAYDLLAEEYRRTLSSYDDAKRAEELANMPHDLSAQPITDEHRFEHTQIVGGSGAGKTTLIETQILEFLARPNPPGLVVIDPKGLLVKRLQRLAVFDPDKGRLRDRLLIIDPEYSPALNMFDMTGMLSNETNTIDIYEYMFASKENPLSDKMSTMFAFLVRVLARVPDASIQQLFDICDDKSIRLNDSPFAPFINTLDRTSVRFFENEFFVKAGEYTSTRSSLKQRLYGVLKCPEFDAAFSTPRRKIDMFDAIQTRKIVLVNADLDRFKEDGCSLFGRTIIGLTLNATFARGRLPKSEWHETFVFVDEAQLFVEEEKTPSFLQLAREYRVGITHAHHGIFSQLSAKLQATMSAMNTIKYVSGVEAGDVAYLARDLRCEPEFIRAQRKTATHAMFACFVRNLMERPASVSIPWQPLAREPQMSEAAHHKLIELNRKKTSMPLQAQGQPLPSPAPPAPPPAPTPTPPRLDPHAAFPPPPQPPKPDPADKPKPGDWADKW